MDLVKKHVLVTGAARRIGRGIAEAVVRQGADLTAHYHHSEKEARELKTLVENQGRRCTLVRADLRSESEIAQAVATAVSQGGPIDVLVNSASVFHGIPNEAVTQKDWTEVLAQNLTGQFFFAREAAKGMLAQKRGVILNIADVHAEKPLRKHTPYVASKAGLVAATRNLALEWAPHVRVNSISPGPVLPPERYTEEVKQRSQSKTLLGRWGTPEDIVHAVLFLVENDYITGFDLKVDGGRALM